MTRRPYFRVAALLLLLFTGVELWACEALAAEQCESFGVPGEESQKTDAGDNCICCCTHVMIVGPSLLEEDHGPASVFERRDPTEVERPASSIYHPPKA